MTVCDLFFYAHKKPGPYPPHPDLAAHNQLETKSLRNRLDCTLKESTALYRLLFQQAWTMCQLPTGHPSKQLLLGTLRFPLLDATGCQK